MDNNFEIMPGTIVWIAPFYNRSGFGVGARAIVIALHRAGAHIKVVPVDQVEDGIDDCDLSLIKELEKTPIIPPVTVVICHVPSQNWLSLNLPEPNVRILATTVFDCCAEGCFPPVEMLDVCRKMDQIWLHVQGEREAFLSAGFPPEMVYTAFWPHPWVENPYLTLACPEVTAPDRPFRFLNISLFVPRRRWDTLIEAYLEEFNSSDNVELYLKVNYPSWHPVPGKPKQDLYELVKALRNKTCSKARIIVDEDIGTRLGIVKLIDSCNVYVSTDTALTAPVAEAAVRRRMVIIPENLTNMPSECYIAIPIDPHAKILLTQEMLMYQPNHRGSSMPLLHVSDVRKALRRAYDMPLSERQARADATSYRAGPQETIPIMLSAISAAWVNKKLQLSKNLCIRWEGSQFVNHSLALVNRELCLRLIERGCEVSIIPYERDQFSPKEEPRLKPIAERTQRQLSGPADVHVRHQWPPNFTPPPEGHWVIIQPWEFGSIPKEWAQNISMHVDEVWVPSSFVRDCYITSGVPAERVFVVPNGVNLSLFNPGIPPYALKTKKRFKFLFVGGTIQRKGIDILLDAYTQAFSSSDDICLVIKDMGGQSFYKGQTAKDIIHGLQANPRNPEIEYIEHFLNDKELAGLYTACDCLAHPYRGEGFGLPIAEAMACELPVIVTGYGAALDFCSPDNAYLVPSRLLRMSEKRIGNLETTDYPWLAEPDRDALKDIMRHVFNHAEEAKTKGKAARIQIETNFTWDKAAEAAIQRINALSLRPILRFEKPAQRSMMNPVAGLVSIVIRLSADIKAAKNCYQSIKDHTSKLHEIIFVVHRSSQQTAKWAKKLADEKTDIKFIENSNDLGFAKENNQGIEASSGEYIMLLNNDVIVMEDWLSGMLECLSSTIDTGIVGPMTNNISGNQKVLDADCKTIPRMIEYAKSFREKYRHRRVSSRKIAGFCMLFRRKLVDKIGLLDENLGTGNFEDDDYCLRANLAGYRNLIAGDVFIPNYGAQTSGNMKIFDEKWTGIDVNTPLGKKVAAFNIIEKADKLNQKGQMNKAIAMFIEGIKYAQEEKIVYYRLAEILLDAKLYKDALEAIQSMPQWSEDDLRRLEIIAYCTEIVEEAEKLADRILTVDKDYAPAFNLKGMNAYRHGDNNTAEDFFKKAIASDPGYGDPYTNIGVMKWESGQKDEALDWLEKGFILSPTITDNVTLYHTAISTMENFARAEKLFQDANKLHPENKKILFFLIDIFIKQGKFGNAMKKIEQAMLNIGLEDGMVEAAIEIRKKAGIKEIDKAAKNKSTLSLCMIVKNEEQHLTRCLMSATPVVDEIIIVDTGSTDRTKDIARAFGAKVFDFPWTNDFSEARNVSLSKATGDWILVLDADEVISSLDYPAIEKIVKKKPAKPVAYNLNTRNYTNEVNTKGWVANDRKYLREEAGIGWFPSAKVRLFANDKRIKFHNPVHEFVEGSLEKAGIEIKPSGIPVHHYGRFDKDKIIAKGREYFILGKKKIEEMKGDIKAMKELAIQASELGEYDTAIELWKRVIELNPNDSIAFMNIGFAYMKLGKYEEAHVASRRAVELEPTMKEAALNYAGSELIIGDIEKTISILETLLGKHHDYPPAMVVVAAAYYIDGQKERSIEIFEKLQKKRFDCTEFFDEHVRGLMSQGSFDQAFSLLEAAIKTGSINKDTKTLLTECQSKMVSKRG